MTKLNKIIGNACGILSVVSALATLIMFLNGETNLTVIGLGIVETCGFMGLFLFYLQLAQQKSIIK